MIPETPLSGKLMRDSSKDTNESAFLSISVRAWLVLLLAGTVCFMSLYDIKIVEPLYSAFLLALGHYFGQKKTQ